jgi:hypothetical protein
MFLALSLSVSVQPARAAEEQALKTEKKTIKKSGKCYKLISGKDNEMCRLFEQNLNRFCDEPPMVCERKIHPDFAKYFSFPKWEEVNPAEHLDIIADYIRARAPERADCPKPVPVIVPKKGESPFVIHPLTESDIRANKAAEECQAEWREKKWQEYRVELLEHLKLGQVKLSCARFEIERYSKKYNLVYRLVDFPCRPLDPEYWNFSHVLKLIVLDEKTSKLDREWTAILGGATYDVLLYKEETYFTTWESGTDKMRIYDPPFTQCMFKYTGKKGGKRK